MEFMARDQLVKGGIYEVRARNFNIAAYDGDEGFIGIRVKFDYEYPFTEYLARTCGGADALYGTVYPIKLLGRVSEGTELVESFFDEKKEVFISNAELEAELRKYGPPRP